MRIDKRIRRILKSQLIFRYGKEFFKDYPELKGWVSSIYNDVLTDPDLDDVATNYGLDAEDLVASVPVIIDVVNGSGLSAVEGLHGDKVYIQITIGTVGYHGFADVLEDTLLHEFVHAARDVSGIGQTGTGDVSLGEWFRNPSEQEAIKAEIRNCMNYGYTDEQILAAYFGPQNYIERLGEELPGAIEAIENMIAELRREEDIMEPTA